MATMNLLTLVRNYDLIDMIIIGWTLLTRDHYGEAFAIPLHPSTYRALIVWKLRSTGQHAADGRAALDAARPDGETDGER